MNPTVLPEFLGDIVVTSQQRSPQNHVPSLLHRSRDLTSSLPPIRMQSQPTKGPVHQAAPDLVMKEIQLLHHDYIRLATTGTIRDGDLPDSFEHYVVEPGCARAVHAKPEHEERVVRSGLEFERHPRPVGPAPDIS